MVRAEIFRGTVVVCILPLRCTDKTGSAVRMRSYLLDRETRLVEALALGARDVSIGLPLFRASVTKDRATMPWNTCLANRRTNSCDHTRADMHVSLLVDLLRRCRLGDQNILVPRVTPNDAGTLGSLKIYVSGRMSSNLCLWFIDSFCRI